MVVFVLFVDCIDTQWCDSLDSAMDGVLLLSFYTWLKKKLRCMLVVTDKILVKKND